MRDLVFVAAMAGVVIVVSTVVNLAGFTLISKEPPPPQTVKFQTLLVSSDGTAIDAVFEISPDDVAALAEGHRWQIMPPREVTK